MESASEEIARDGGTIGPKNGLDAALPCPNDMRLLLVVATPAAASWRRNGSSPRMESREGEDARLTATEFTTVLEVVLPPELMSPVADSRRPRVRLGKLGELLMEQIVEALLSGRGVSRVTVPRSRRRPCLAAGG